MINVYVVKGVDLVIVKFKDGWSFEGEVRGFDEFFDLVVIKIDGEKLFVVFLGNFDIVKVGDWVIVVGNFLGLDNIVILGIVSFLNCVSFEVGIFEKCFDFI